MDFLHKHVVKATCFQFTNSNWQLSDCIFSEIVVSFYIFRKIFLGQNCKNYIWYA